MERRKCQGGGTSVRQDIFAVRAILNGGKKLATQFIVNCVNLYGDNEQF
eukprot:gene3427-3920_t